MVATNSFDHSDFNWQTSFHIGFSNDMGNFDGLIDNVRIWNTVRTQSELTENMYLNSPSDTALVANYLMEGNANATTSGNNGIAYNNSWIDDNFLTYTWYGTGAPSPSLNQTELTNPLFSSVNFTVSASGGGCQGIVSAIAPITVNTPTLADTLTNSDMIWKGTTNADWNTLSNWWQYIGNSYTNAIAVPTAAQNVIIPINQTCVLNQPNTLANSVSVNNLIIETGASLSMTNGTLSVSGNWVNNGNFVPGSGTVEFSGTAPNQTITRAAGETFNNLTINKGAGVVSLVNSIAVNSTLNLSSGIIDLQASNLNLGSSNLVGGSDISYVKTSGAGTLNRNVSGSATIFPVGNVAFNPATLTNAGTADNFSVRVYDYVSTTGVQGGAPTTGQVVNRTWMVSEGTVGGSNVTLKMQWNAGEETNGFVYNPGFMNVGHHNGAIWEELGALNQGSSPFYVEQTGISSFSPFIIATTGTVLPIELTSFQANCVGDNNVSVTWTTASEHNTSHFIVEKSRDGNNWTALGVVTAAGNSTSMINYSLGDENANAGITYYRLTQYDNDGAFEMFNAVSTNCANNSNDAVVTVYPNPSNGEFFIDLFTEEITGEAVVTITDSKGVIVKYLPVFVTKGSNTFHVNGLEAAPGMYYIQVSNGTSSSSIVKHSLR